MATIRKRRERIRLLIPLQWILAIVFVWYQCRYYYHHSGHNKNSINTNHRRECNPKTHVYIKDWGDDANNHSNGHKQRTMMIPPVLYQTGISRCVPKLVYEQGVGQWMKLIVESSNRRQGKPSFLSSYRFMDDAAVDAFLFDSKWRTEFPGLHYALRCIDQSSGSSSNSHIKIMKSDLWRYLYLWEYGGMYADLDTIPQKKLLQPVNNNHQDRDDDDALSSFLHSTMRNNDNENDQPAAKQATTADAWFVQSVHFDWGITPSQWWFATIPKHPLLHIAIQVSIHNILMSSLDEDDVDSRNNNNPLYQTGPVALLHATEMFLNPSHSHRRNSSNSSSNNNNRDNTTQHAANKLRPGIVYASNHNNHDRPSYNFHVLPHQGYVQHFSFSQGIKEQFYQEYNQAYYYTEMNNNKSGRRKKSKEQNKEVDQKRRCIQSFVGGRIVANDDTNDYYDPRLGTTRTTATRIMINDTVLSDSSRIGLPTRKIM
jgi:hypothetical protein